MKGLIQRAVSSLEHITIYNKLTVYDQLQPRQDTAWFSCRIENEDLYRQGITLLDFAPRAILQIGNKILFHLESESLSNHICSMRFQDGFENTFDVKMSISRQQHAFHTIYAAIGQDNSSRPFPHLPKSGTYWSHPGWSRIAIGFYGIGKVAICG